MHRNTYALGAATALLVCALIASGCGGSGHRDHHAPPAAAPSGQPGSPAPASTVLPSAANGTDTGACADASCEVLLTHAVTLKMHCGCGLAMLRMSISSGGVDFDGTAADGTLVSFHDQLPGQGGPSMFGQVSVAVIAFNGKEAVIRLSD